METGDSVFTVEQRTHLDKFKREQRDFFEGDVVFVASDEEKAENWIKKNTSLSEHDKKNFWWFIVVKRPVNLDERMFVSSDGTLMGGYGLVAVYDWDGNKMDEQPIEGYAGMSIYE